MPTYKAPVPDMLYVMNDVLKLERFSNLKSFAESTPDIIAAILEEGAKINEEVLQPLNRSGDKEGCTRNDDGTVTTPKGFKEAYDLFSQGGWNGLTLLGMAAITVAVLLTLALHGVAEVRTGRVDLTVAQTLGFSRLQLTASLALERVVVAVLGIGVGAGVGLWMGRWVLGFLDITPRGGL